MIELSNNKKRITHADLESLADEIENVNVHIRACTDILTTRYNVTERQKEILYNNVEKIADVLANRAKVPSDDYKVISPILCVMQSEYLMDTIRAFEKDKNLVISLITKDAALAYVTKLLMMYDVDQPDFPKDELIFSLKESNLPISDTLYNGN